MPHEYQTLDWSIEPIPARIVIGVTGHRTLSMDFDLVKRIRRALQEIKSRLPRLESTPVVFDILSPLAEGADRLVAREVLEGPEARLLAVLPMPEEQYLDDFESDDSKREFLRLLNRASHTWSIPASSDRNEAYKDAGRFVVDHCDFLIALWDGKPASGPGGTSEIVEYARISGRPLIWIHTEDPHVTVENAVGVDVKSFEELDAYNAEPLSRAEIERRAMEQYRLLGTQAEEAGFPLDKLRPIREHFLPHFVRADVLAERYQNWYVWAGFAIYIFAALATSFAATQALFFPDGFQGARLATNPQSLVEKFGLALGNKPFLALEAGLLVLVVSIVALGWRKRWHTKWLDYRFLAERFRSALFLAAAGVTVTENLPRYFAMSYSSKDWMMRAFSWVWHQLPGSQDLNDTDAPILEQLHLPSLKQFVLSAWIGDQLAYYERAAARNDRTHKYLVGGGLLLFLAGLVIAVVHLFLGALREHGHLEHYLSFGNIALPAWASALAAIRAHGEYERIAERSKETLRAIEALKAEMVQERHAGMFTRLVAEAEQTMLHENQDWRALFRSRRLEPGG